MSVDTYSTAGAFTWTAPAGVISVQAECWGGGEGGGGAPGALGRGTHGGVGGGYARKNSIVVIPGNNYTVTVGAAGTAGIATGSTEGPGGDSWFSTTGTVLGAGGNGSGGTAQVGDVTFSGGTSPDPTLGNLGGSGGGSSAGTSAGGFNGTAGGATAGSSGGLAPSGGGNGGHGGTNITDAGLTAGSAPGGGGGGGGNQADGAAGAAGQVVLTYFVAPAPEPMAWRQPGWSFEESREETIYH